MRYLFIVLLCVISLRGVGQTDIQKLELSVIEQYISWQDERDKSCQRFFDLKKDDLRFDAQKEAYQKMLRDWEKQGVDISSFINAYKENDDSVWHKAIIPASILRKVRTFERYFSTDKQDQQRIAIYGFSRMIFLNKGQYCIVRIRNSGGFEYGGETMTYLLTIKNGKWEILQKYDPFVVLGG